MLRITSIRKDLRQGFRNLHRYWGLKLEYKIRYSNRLIEKVFENHSKPVVCWSGGKDSTVILHLILKYAPDIPVIYNDTGVEFPETRSFVKQIASEWNLNLFVAKPNRGETFWNCVKMHGWPMFGKAQALSIEQARRTGNIRSSLSAFERTLALEGVSISSRCCDFTRERPTKRVESEIGANAKFLGIMASESRSRMRLFVDHGDYYFVKRYFGRRRGMWKASPISVWQENDIWEYHSLYNLPHCSLYDMGHQRNGCWPCAMGIKFGQLGRLRISHPKLFRYLILRTELGTQIIKAKLALDTNSNYEFSKLKRESILEAYPCFFDRF